MDRINWKFSDRFRSNWIKVKFYKEKPSLEKVKRLKNVRFCEATKEAITCPLLLGKMDISCLGAQYAFGWKSDFKDKPLDNCHEKRQIQKKKIKSMLSQIPCLNGDFNYIGLNTEGEPDLIMSYMSPREVMPLIRVYNNHTGENLNISLSNMMAICGGVAVRSYLTKNICLSFGCDDSRKYADIKRENVAVGIPSRLFKVFVD